MTSGRERMKGCICGMLLRLFPYFCILFIVFAIWDSDKLSDNFYCSKSKFPLVLVGPKLFF